MVPPLRERAVDEQLSPRSLAHRDHYDADLDLLRVGTPIRALVVELRDAVDRGTATDGQWNACSFNDLYLAALGRCVDGTCKPDRAHHFDRCIASGKSRADRFDPERPLAAAVPA